MCILDLGFVPSLKNRKGDGQKKPETLLMPAAMVRSITFISRSNTRRKYVNKTDLSGAFMMDLDQRTENINQYFWPTVVYKLLSRARLR